MDLYPRPIASVVQRALRTSPVVVVEGPRGVGKTTLSKQFGLTYRSLLDVATREAATSSPRDWVEALPVGSVIDEAQLLGGASLEIKRIVDERGGVPGQFVLTGSARLRRNELGGSDPLVGRTRNIELLPLTQCEIERSPRDVITGLFDEEPTTWTLESGERQQETLSRIVKSGIPALRTDDLIEQTQRQRDYVEGLFLGDVYQAGNRRTGIVRLFRHLATVSGAVSDLTKYGRAIDMSHTTVGDYLDALDAVFLTWKVPAWHSTASGRGTRKDRVFLADPSFAASALGIAVDQSIGPHEGNLFETFVACELRALLGWSTTAGTKMFHWRKDDNNEVDLVLEAPDGRLVGIEVKSAREHKDAHFKGLRAFRSAHSDRFHRGFVMQPCDHPFRSSDGLWAIPLEALWRVGEVVAATSAISSFDAALADARRTLHATLSPNEVLASVTSALAEASTRLEAIGNLFAEHNLEATVSGHRVCAPLPPSQEAVGVVRLAVKSPYGARYQLDLSATGGSRGVVTWTVGVGDGRDSTGLDLDELLARRIADIPTEVWRLHGSTPPPNT